MKYNWFRRIVLGHRPDSSAGSNARRTWSRIAKYVVAYLVFDLAMRGDIWTVSAVSMLVAAVLCLYASVFFFSNVVSVLFLVSSDFWPDPVRLMLDTVTSIALTVFSFGLLYAQLGIIGSEQIFRDPLTAVYFSAVTFSTLGYGDFAPGNSARLPAAYQAILGNLHLGMIVGAMFFATQRQKSGKDTEENSPNKDDSG